MLALAEFAHAIGAGRGQQLLRVLDRAGGHVGRQVQVPAGTHRHPLPPYSPELQPAERLWSPPNEALAHRHVHDLYDLQTVRAQGCQQLHARPEAIEASTNFHRWPQST
jgi:hypothetical protein